jgi:elongation factor Tu
MISRATTFRSSVGRRLCALEDKNPEIGEQAILKLMEAVDEYIPQPERPKDRRS